MKKWEIKKNRKRKWFIIFRLSSKYVIKKQRCFFFVFLSHQELTSLISKYRSLKRKTFQLFFWIVILFIFLVGFQISLFFKLFFYTITDVNAVKSLKKQKVCNVEHGISYLFFVLLVPTKPIIFIANKFVLLYLFLFRVKGFVVGTKEPNPQHLGFFNKKIKIFSYFFF